MSTSTLLDRQADARYVVLGDENGRATKGASDYADPNPVEAEHVVNQMRRNYPEKALAWMRDARWLGPVQVPQERIDYDDETKWAAAHETGRVNHFAKQIRKGKAHLHPVVAVQEPGDDKIKVIDGHHRTLAYRKLGRPVTAYVGLVDQDGGPWDETHAFQDHPGTSPANKAATLGKDEVNYRHHTGSRMCGTCVMFTASGDDDSGVCTLVRGVIASDAVCDRWEPRGAEKARSYELNPRSGMISLDLPPGVVTPVPGGVDDHHVTVVYLGPDVDDDTWHGALTAAGEVAGTTPRLSGVVSGLGTFPAGKDGVPAYAEVALPGVVELHARLAHLQHASAAARTHGYTPHMTLAYLADGDEPPAPVPATPVTFTELSAHRGDEVWRFPLAGDAAKRDDGEHGDGHDSAERLREYWTHGEGAAKIRWGEPGDFDRCVRYLGKFIADPKGYCNLRHHDALGIYPATHAKEERGGKTLLPLIVKVGPEGYIHGFICVRPPCGKGGAEPHTFTKKTGQVHHGDGTYIGKVYGKGGKFWGSHNGGGIGQGKMKLGATYDSAADAATSVAHYHNLHVLAAEAEKQHLPSVFQNLTKAHQALSAGDAKLAGERIATAHERALDTAGGESHPLLDSLAEEHRAFDQFHGLGHTEPDHAPAAPVPALKPAPKPPIPATPAPVAKPKPVPAPPAPAKKAPAKKPAKAIDTNELANRATFLHSVTNQKLQAEYMPMSMRDDYEKMAPADKLRKGDYLGALGDLHALDQLEKTQVYGTNQGKEYAALRRDVLKAHAASQAGLTRTEKIAALHDYAKGLQAHGQLSHKNGSFGVSQVVDHLSSAHFSSVMAESAGSDSLGNVVTSLDQAAAKLTPYKHGTMKSMVGNTLAVRDVVKRLSGEISGPVSKTPPKPKPEDLPAGHLHPGVKGAVGVAKADDLLTTNPRTGKKVVGASDAKQAVAERLALELRDVPAQDLARVALHISGGYGSSIAQDVVDHPEKYRFNVKTKQYVDAAQVAGYKKDASELLASVDATPPDKIGDGSLDRYEYSRLLRSVATGVPNGDTAANVLRGEKLYRGSGGDYTTNLNFGASPGYVKVSPQEAKQFVRDIVAHVPKNIDDVHVGVDDQRATAELKTAAISKMISQWAQSSNNAHAVALAIQRAATAEFNLDDPAPWHLEKDDLKDRVDQIYGENEATLRRFVRAQYDITQRDLAKAGVTHVNLYRSFTWGSSSQIPDWAQHKDAGVGTFKGVAEKGEHISPVFRPLSSWSSSSAQAGKFFSTYASGSSHRMMIKASVPAERIFSYPQSGYGCLEEKEFVVLHSPGLAEVSRSAG